MTVFCYQLTGTLEVLSSLHIGSGRRTGVIKHTHPYIPGSVLRGAVGVSFMRSVCKLDKPLNDHTRCEFFDDCAYAKLFAEEFGKSSKVFFRFSYPIHMTCQGTFYPSPKNLYRCRNPQCRKTFTSFIPPENCDVCNSSVKPYRGYQCSECNVLESYPVSTSRITLTAIDRKHVSAATVVAGGEVSGTLHTLEVIDKGSRFKVDVIVHRDCSDTLDSMKNIFEKALPDEGIGGSKSRGLGKVIVGNLKVEPVDTDILEKRAEEIDTKSFSVRLLSPMILDGKPLEPSSLLEGARRAYSWAFHKGKPKLPTLRVTHRAVDGGFFSGWSLKAQKRRRLMSAVSAGSVFHFESDVDDWDLALGLSALEYYAIGDYKPHGCGQIKVESFIGGD